MFFLKQATTAPNMSDSQLVVAAQADSNKNLKAPAMAAAAAETDESTLLNPATAIEKIENILNAAVDNFATVVARPEINSQMLLLAGSSATSFALEIAAAAENAPEDTGFIALAASIASAVVNSATQLKNFYHRLDRIQSTQIAILDEITRPENIRFIKKASYYDQTKGTFVDLSKPYTKEDILKCLSSNQNVAIELLGTAPNENLCFVDSSLFSLKNAA